MSWPPSLHIECLLEANIEHSSLEPLAFNGLEQHHWR